MKKLLACLLIFSMLVLGGCFESADDPHGNGSSGSSDESISPDIRDLTVHFIDVGQGDSIFIELPNGESMLVDAGERDAAGRVISYIDALGYKKIDYVVATHPHSDHIGGLTNVMSMFEIGEVYMPNAVSDTETYETLLKYIESRGLSIVPVSAGLTPKFNTEAKIKFVGPRRKDTENMNNNSAILHITYGEKSFLFSGDAEEMAEMLAMGAIKCDVLKVGHHGSSTSSTERYLERANPLYAVISVGKDNEYGHPHKEALERLEAAGVQKVFRTDVSGNIKMSTDGYGIKVTENVTVNDGKWILNISSKKLHSATCTDAATMSVTNRATSSRSLSELQALGYTPCGSCKPAE